MKNKGYDTWQMKPAKLFILISINAKWTIAIEHEWTDKTHVDDANLILEHAISRSCRHNK